MFVGICSPAAVGCGGGFLSAPLTQDSPTQCHTIGSSLGGLGDDVFALLGEEVHPLRDSYNVKAKVPPSVGMFVILPWSQRNACWVGSPVLAFATAFVKD